VPVSITPTGEALCTSASMFYQLSQSTVRLATCYIISYSGPNVNPFFQLFFGKSKFFCEVFEAAKNPEMAQDFQPECAFVVVGQTGKHGFTADSVAIETTVRENLAALHATKEAAAVHVEIEYRYSKALPAMGRAQLVLLAIRL